MKPSIKASRIKAIKECKQMWKDIADSKLSKYSFLRSSKGAKWEAKGYSGNCPLCDFVSSLGVEGGLCTDCPLKTQFGETCNSLGYMSSLPCPEFWDYVEQLEVK